jgi:hypothetical protein
VLCVADDVGPGYAGCDTRPRGDCKFEGGEGDARCYWDTAAGKCRPASYFGCADWARRAPLKHRKVTRRIAYYSHWARWNQGDLKALFGQADEAVLYFDGHGKPPRVFVTAALNILVVAPGTPGSSVSARDFGCGGNDTLDARSAAFLTETENYQWSLTVLHRVRDGVRLELTENQHVSYVEPPPGLEWKRASQSPVTFGLDVRLMGPPPAVPNSSWNYEYEYALRALYPCKFPRWIPQHAARRSEKVELGVFTQCGGPRVTDDLASLRVLGACARSEAPILRRSRAGHQRTGAVHVRPSFRRMYRKWLAFAELRRAPRRHRIQ